MITAFILAGVRQDGDPVAVSQGKLLKALVDIHGKAMIDYVLEALQACGRVEKIIVCVPKHIEFTPFMSDLAENGYLFVIAPADSPAQSVDRMFACVGRCEDVLVTTADHPLLSAEMINYFIDNAYSPVSVGMAELDVVRRAYPETRRTRLRFADGAYSGCNLFFFKGEESRRAVLYWQKLESLRKKPISMARRIGFYTLIGYVFNRLRLCDILNSIGERAGVKISAVLLPYADAAIDVDKVDDLNLVTKILKEKK